MKIGFVVLGGVDRSGEYRVTPCLLWLLERLAREHEVHVFALRQEPRPSRYPLLGTQVCNIGARPRVPGAIAAIAAEHRRSPFDLLHAVGAAPMGVAAAAAGRMIRAPVLLHITGGDLVALPEIGYGGRANWRGRMWLKAALAGARRVVVPNLATQRLAEQLGVPALRLPFGVALDRWPPREPQSHPPGERARLLHVGSLNPVKDQKTLLLATKELHRAGVRFDLDIAGADTTAGEIERFAGECGLADRVNFHGFLPHKKLRPLVERADILLVSSRHETGPIVLLEAAVAGVPTVGTAVGHVREWAPEAAVAVPIADPKALADATRSLLQNDTRRMAIAKDAQARALRHDADCTARRIMQLYQEIVSTR